jgi:hypothetical protein
LLHAFSASHATVAGNSAGAGGGADATTAGAGGSAGSGDPAGSAGQGGNATAASPGAPGIVGGFNGNGTLRNTVLASNSPTNCFSSGLADGGHNVSTDATCPATQGDPKLRPLADNGGLGATMGLDPGSAALDIVPAGGAGCPVADERGIGRPQGVACDSGAYEAAMPVARTDPATAVGTSSAALNGAVTPFHPTASVHFDYGTTTAYGASTPPRDAGAFSGSRTVADTVGGLAPGTTYHFRLAATTPDGTSFGADQAFTTAGSPPAGNKPPSITSASLSNAVFVAAARTPTTARAKRGTTIRYSLSEAATLRIVIERAAAGKRKGRRCVKPTRALRRARPCTRWLKAGTLSRRVAQGRGSTKFTGRIGRKALRPGRHRFRLTARDADGAHSPTRTLAFRIVRR